MIRVIHDLLASSNDDFRVIIKMISYGINNYRSKCR